jgi:carboxylesterase type B
MAPDGATNLAVKDVINAMKFLKNVVSAFGGSASRITLAGQSSGANMIRALLAVPSASSLFTSAILQSDPMVSFISVFCDVTSEYLADNCPGLWLPCSSHSAEIAK